MAPSVFLRRSTKQNSREEAWWSGRCQMLAILHQQPTDGGHIFRLQPLPVELAVILKGLLGVQGQQLQLRHTLQHAQQLLHLCPNALLRQNIQIAGMNEVEGQLSAPVTTLSFVMSSMPMSCRVDFFLLMPIPSTHNIVV